MKLGIIILLLNSQAAFARFGGVTSVSETCGPCKKSTMARNAEFLHQAALMAMRDDKGNVIKDKDGLYKDTRGKLYELAPQFSGDLKLNSAEIQDVNNASPMIECKSDLKPSTTAVSKAPVTYDKRDGSGFLYGNGEQYVTAAHNLFDAEGKLFKSCVLRAHANSEMKDHVPLDLSMIEIMNDPNGRPGSAVAVVKLKNKQYKRNGTPIEGLALNESGKPVDFGGKFVMVSSVQYKGDRTRPDVRNENEKLGGPGQQQIVQEAKRPDDPDARKMSQSFYAEASSTAGNSGAYGYTRQANGKIAVEVIFTGAGAGRRDGTTFNMDGQFTYGFILNQARVRQMMDFQDRAKL